MGNSISHSTVRIILVPNVFEQYRVPLLKQRSTCEKGCDPIDIIFLHCCQGSKCQSYYVSYIKQILSGYNSWDGRNIIAR